MSKTENPNDNCLAGFECPKCGSFGPFNIDVVTILTVHDDGSGDSEGAEWEDDSACHCPVCDHRATVGHFTGRPPETPASFTIDVAAQIDACGYSVSDMQAAVKAVEETIYSYLGDFLGDILESANCGYVEESNESETV